MKTDNPFSVLNESLRDLADESLLSYGWSKIMEREERRKSRKRIAAITVVAVVVLSAGFGITQLSFSKPTTESAPITLNIPERIPVITVPVDAMNAKRVDLSDGSRLTLSPGANLQVLTNTGKRFEMELTSGWVRFNVRPGQERVWTIDAGMARIVVQGTMFTVNRTRSAVAVSVHRGKVEVQPQSEEMMPILLAAGQTHRFVTVHQKNQATETPLKKVTVASETVQAAPSMTTTVRPADKKSLKRPRHPVETPVPDLAGMGASKRVNELLKEVDVARKNRRYREAARLLERILREFNADPAAGFWVMTLGRIRLYNLNQPRAAAAAFKQASENKNLPPPLREQACARSVEAFHKSGNWAAVRAAKQRYKTRFPDGAWNDWLEQWGEGTN